MKENLIYGLLGGFIGFLYLGWISLPKSSQSSHASLAVVDMQALISKKSQQLAAMLASEKHSSQPRESSSFLSIQDAAHRLKDDLNTFAATHNLVILSKEAVVSGDLPDKAEEILVLIEETIIKEGYQP
jgi:hypothetical protein